MFEHLARLATPYFTNLEKAHVQNQGDAYYAGLTLQGRVLRQVVRFGVVFTKCHCASATGHDERRRTRHDVSWRHDAMPFLHAFFTRSTNADVYSYSTTKVFRSGQQQIRKTDTAVGNASVEVWCCETCSAINQSGLDDGTNGARQHRNSEPVCSVCMKRRCGEEAGVPQSHKWNWSSKDDCCERGRRGITLAQMRGLEEMPEPLLTPSEWR